MSRQVVNEDQYLEICNRELQRDPEYKEGMRITGVPKGSSGSGLSGYDWKGPKATMPALVSKIVRAVEKQHELR